MGRGTVLMMIVASIDREALLPEAAAARRSAKGMIRTAGAEHGCLGG